MGGDHFKETRDGYRGRRGERVGSIFLEDQHIESPRLQHFCIQKMMSTCTASDNPDRQKTCEFHIPNSGYNHCMELRFNEYCSCTTLHKYMKGTIRSDYAKKLISHEKDRIAGINDRVAGYHIKFPLKGEETQASVQNIWDQLQDLGILTAEFWVDEHGKSGTTYEHFSVSWTDITSGKWVPKRKELQKDILRYMEIKDRFAA
jgi:hypothetical protein